MPKSHSSVGNARLSPWFRRWGYSSLSGDDRVFNAKIFSERTIFERTSSLRDLSKTGRRLFTSASESVSIVASVEHQSQPGRTNQHLHSSALSADHVEFFEEKCSTVVHRFEHERTIFSKFTDTDPEIRKYSGKIFQPARTSTTDDNQPVGSVRI